MHDDDALVEAADNIAGVRAARHGLAEHEAIDRIVDEDRALAGEHRYKRNPQAHADDGQADEVPPVVNFRGPWACEQRENEQHVHGHEQAGMHREKSTERERTRDAAPCGGAGIARHRHQPQDGPESDHRCLEPVQAEQDESIPAPPQQARERHQIRQDQNRRNEKSLRPGRADVMGCGHRGRHRRSKPHPVHSTKH